MRGIVGLVLVVGFLCPPPWGPSPLSAQIGQVEVTGLSFQGNRSFSSGALANAIITRETECRSRLLFVFCMAGAEFSLEPYFLLDREFRRDLARVQLFYYRMGYRETAVDTLIERPSEEEINITFRIEEGEPIRITELTFTGLEELPDSSILDDLPLEVGDPLSLLAWEATEDTLVGRLLNQGYAHAEVLKGYDISSDPPYEALAAFDLYLGPLVRFGPLTVVGNRAVDEGTVRRMLPFREGDIYGRDLRFAGQRNLYNLEIFSFVDIVADLEHQPDSIVPLRIQVGEGQLRRVRTGAGLSTADCLNAEASWASRNFLGGARQLQFTGRVSNVMASEFQSTLLCRDAGTGEYGRLNWLLSADFTQPWLFSARNSLTTSFFWERQSLPEIFVRESQGLNLAVTRTLAVSTLLTFSLRPQITRLEAAEIFFCSNYLICTPGDIGILQEPNWLAPVGVSLSQDRRNQALSPTRGYSALLDLEHAAEWSGSKYLYTRAMAEGTWYTQSESGWVIATRLRGGWVHPGGFSGLGGAASSDEVVHPNTRLYAGGSNSVRGFAQNRLGPQVLEAEVEELLAPRGQNQDQPPLCTPEEIQDKSCDARGLGDNRFAPRPTGGTSMVEGGLELRFPLSGQLWEGATFVDFGQVWGEGASPKWNDVELTPGLGVRYFSPIGPIRVDLAYRFGGGKQLQVVTANVRPFDPGLDDADTPKLAGLDWVEAEDLALLGPRVLFGDHNPWSLRRLQLHLSIGQAF